MGIPRRIGAFVPFAEIAQGPATSVYKAHDPEHDRVVVVKLLRGLFAGDEDLARRFRSEAAALRVVSSPHVVDIIAFGECEDGLFIATQFVEGESLDGLLRTRSVPAAIGAFIVREAIAGLAAVHEAGLLHRDFKPSNILVGEAGDVRLLDFGLAQSPADGAEPVAGTVGYLAPELLAGDEPTRKSDLYSAGVTLAEVLTGRPAERLVSRSADGRASIARESAADSIREMLVAPGIHPGLADCASVLAASDPACRPEDAAEALELLDIAFDAFRPRVASPTVGAWLTRERMTLPRPVQGTEQDAASTAMVEPTHAIVVNDSGRRTPQAAWPRTGVVVAAALVATAAFALTSLRSDKADDGFDSEEVAALPPSSDAPPPSQTRRDVTIGDLNPGTGESDVHPTGTPEDTTTELPAGNEGGAPSDTTTDGAVTDVTGRPDVIEPSIDPNAPATVAVVALPWARVTVDGTEVGVTPLASPIVLDPGVHLIRFENPAFPPHDVRFEALPGDTTDVRVSLWSTVARVVLLVTPWAEVLVDGSVRDTIPPMDQPLILPPGETTLTLRHPELGVHETTLNLRADSTYRLSYNLYDLERD